VATDLPPAPLPRSTSADRRQPKPGRGNFELYAWVFMRVSGVLLVLLVLAQAYDRSIYFDLALALALLSFAGGLVFARFLERWI